MYQNRKTVGNRRSPLRGLGRAAQLLGLILIPSALVAGDVVPIGKVVIEYKLNHEQHPLADDLLKATVTLVPTEGGYTAPAKVKAEAPVEGEEKPAPEASPAEVSVALGELGQLSPAALDLAGIRAVSQAVVDALNKRGLVGVYVRPAQEDLAVKKGKLIDKRKGGTDLRLAVDTAVVCEVRSVGSGGRIDEQSTHVDNPIHQQIVQNSPLTPDPDDAAKGDLIWRDQLDNYLLRLNRHPGRRVESAISAAAAPNTVTLDYLVAETKPWTAYLQALNTGTETTNKWRERVGFIHRQLTGHDDILAIDYVTTGFGQDANSLQLEYEFPLSGVGGRLRGKLFGAYSEYAASDVGSTADDWEGESWLAGAELAFTLLQIKTTFVDVVAGARFQNEATTNLTQAGLAGGTGDTFYEGDTDFLVAYGGLRLERRTDLSSTDIAVLLETSCPNLANTDDMEADRLGRLDVDTDWTLLRWSARHSFHLESLFALLDGNASRIPETSAHEIVLRCNGQQVLGNERLPAQFQDVLGGFFSVRGYGETSSAGDSSVLGSAEYCLHMVADWARNDTPDKAEGEDSQDGHWPLRLGLRKPGTSHDLGLTWRLFLDAGRTRVSAKTPSDRDATMLACGTGLETRIRHGKLDLSIRCDWGYVLRDIEDAYGEVEDDAGKGDDRFHLMATLLF